MSESRQSLSSVLDRIQKTAKDKSGDPGASKKTAGKADDTANDVSDGDVETKEAADKKEAAELKEAMSALGEIMARKFIEGVTKEAEALIGSTHPDPATAWAGRVWAPISRALANRRGYNASASDPGIKDTYESGNFTGRPTKG